MSGNLNTLLIALLLLSMPALALDAASWPLNLGIAIPTLIISVLFGYFLARSAYGEFFVLLLSMIYGFVTVLIVAAVNQSPNVIYGMEQVLVRVLEWLVDAFTGGINQDNLVFSMVVSTLFWFFGYNAAWHLFRVDRVWRVVIPPGLILIVNTVIYAGDANLDPYMLGFVLAVLLLIVRSNLDAREWDWYVNKVQVPKKLRRQFLAVGTVLSIAALLLAWLVPSYDLQERLRAFQDFLSAEPLRELSEFWNRLVGPIESEGPATADYYGGDSLNLSGAIRLGDQEIMYIQAPTENRYYWRSRVFELYSGGRWLPSATRRVPDLSVPLVIAPPPGGELGRRQVEQIFTMSSAARLIYAAPQPMTISLPGRIDLLRTSGNQDDAFSPMNISVIRPERVVQRGESYTVVSEISVASADELRSAGTTYPDWVSNPNAYAGGISQRVALLAQQIVADAGATTPYDRAKAIETWLRDEIRYNETIPPPPAGVDSVEWFLFEIREGYCTYYSTAMIAMLRTLGIPARMAAGFSEGTYNPSIDRYVVIEKDAHTWVEVYFPGYGWVEFEPTSAQQPITRAGDTESQSTLAIPTGEPSPTPSPTPLPSPTPQATPTQQEGTPQQGNSAPPTLTPSPTPTTTPVIVPTVAPPVTPPPAPQGDFLSFLLPALTVALILIGSIILLILLLLFTYWWWEWRGMGGLSPVSRAYARLMRYISLIGVRSYEQETPEERRQKIIQQLPKAEKPVSAITHAYTAERYGPAREDDARTDNTAQRADQAWQDARHNILIRWLRKRMPFLKD